MNVITQSSYKFFYFLSCVFFFFLFYINTCSPTKKTTQNLIKRKNGSVQTMYPMISILRVEIRSPFLFFFSVFFFLVSRQHLSYHFNTTEAALFFLAVYLFIYLFLVFSFSSYHLHPFSMILKLNGR